MEKENKVESTGDDLLNVGVDSFEDSLKELDASTIDEYSSNMDYDAFIVLSKKNLLDFCRIVEPLTKASNDEYGKSVYIRPIDKDTVVISYWNSPYRVVCKVPNRSGKKVTPFFISVVNLKKLTNTAYTSLVIVENEGQMNLSVCGSLLFIETKQLNNEFYKFDKVECKLPIDKEKSSFVFRRVSQILSCSDRASERVMVIKNGNAYINTGFFAAKVASPFGSSSDFVLWKVITDVLAALADITKVDFKYIITHQEDEDILHVSVDGMIYCELPIGKEEKVSEFYNPNISRILNFDANVVIVNDSILRLASIVKSVDYLADIVSIGFDDKEIIFKIFSSDMSKPSTYSFPITEGKPEVTGEMKQNVVVISTFLNLCGTDVKYAFTEDGFGISNKNGKFLVRKNS